MNHTLSNYSHLATAWTRSKHIHIDTRGNLEALPLPLFTTAPFRVGTFATGVLETADDDTCADSDKFKKKSVYHYVRLMLQFYRWSLDNEIMDRR